MTPDELRLVLDDYFIPMYQIVGGLAAVVVIFLACYLVLGPFLRRLK